MRPYSWMMPIRFAVGLVMAGAFVACGISGDDPTPTPIADPSLAISEAVQKMRGLDSYHMDIAFSPVGAPVASYVDYDKGDYFERIPADLASVTDGKEYIYAGEYLFTRECTRPDFCNDWLRSSERPLVPSLAGTVNSIPETLAVVAAETGTGWQIAPTAGEVTFRGAVNINKATEENQRRALTAVGYSPAEVEERIRKLSENIAPAPDSVIDVTLSPEGLINKLTIYVPTRPTDPYFETTFSGFNQVEVTAPSEFIDSRS